MGDTDLPSKWIKPDHWHLVVDLQICLRFSMLYNWGMVDNNGLACAAGGGLLDDLRVEWIGLSHHTQSIFVMVNDLGSVWQSVG